ncbi:MAG TPA: hypothetical protein PLZ55_18980 [bacterium]|nr:hypothetical protein [bacterium]
MQDFSPDLHRRKADEIPAFVGMMGNVKTLTPTLSRWEREHLEVFPGGREDNEGARPWGAQPWGAQPCAPTVSDCQSTIRNPQLRNPNGAWQDSPR